MTPKVVVLDYASTPDIDFPEKSPGSKAVNYARAIKASVILTGAPATGILFDRGQSVNPMLFGLEVSEDAVVGETDPIGLLAGIRRQESFR